MVGWLVAKNSLAAVVVDATSMFVLDVAYVHSAYTCFQRTRQET